MLDEPLRRLKEAVLQPAAQRIGTWLHPITLSLIGFGFGLLAAISAYAGISLAAAALWLANRAFDGLDGTVARTHGKQSDLGGYLDLLLDFTIYALIPLGLAAGSSDANAAPAAALLLGSFYLNAASWMALSAIMEKRGQGTSDTHSTTLVMPGGLIEGAETVLIFTVLLLLPAQMVPLFMLMGLLVLLTVAQRVIWAVRHL